MNTQKEIYKRLIRVIPNLYSINESGKSETQGFMDFHLDILQRKGDVLRVAISHYYKHPSGDMIADPDMEILVNRKTEAAEALTYQDIYQYQEVYSEDGSCNASLQRSLNEFLLMWLRNLHEQGHKIE
ncbi:DUF1249 domain-containing protein [Gammaproteobacteria bacterium]|nr:DUF1249 domain-containing protein [Gammaproteobacteria bacterium]